MVAALCANLEASNVGASGRCDAAHVNIRNLCRTTTVTITAWAVGGAVR